MPGNIDPIYSRTGDIQHSGQYNSASVIGPSADTSRTGNATNIYLIWSADATNGGFIQRIRLKSVALNGNNPAATVARFFICTDTGDPNSFTAGTTNTEANTFLLGELSLPGVTSSNTAATPEFDYPLNLALPAGYKVLISFGTSTGSAGVGYRASAFGGKY